MKEPVESAEDEPRRITTIKYTECFAAKLTKLKRKNPDAARQAANALKDLLSNPFPSRLHFHPLKATNVGTANKPVKVYTIHLTGDDTLKASLTLDGQVATMRNIDDHDSIEKDP